jgi:hypothetical protein
MQKRMDQVGFCSPCVYSNDLIESSLRMMLRMKKMCRKVLKITPGYPSRSVNTPFRTIARSCASFAKVSFNSKVDEGLQIQQLSGGQKSLVALATGERRRLSATK